MVTVRPANSSDADAIWRVLEPAIRAGEACALPRDWGSDQVLDYWMATSHWVFVALDNHQQDERVVGSYFLRANQQGGGVFVANCGYVTEPQERGRGVASAMCAHSLETARALGFRAMQFNFVVASNERAVRLWEKFEFKTIGRVPEAFLHPRLGWVDALVMHRFL